MDSGISVSGLLARAVLVALLTALVGMVDPALQAADPASAESLETPGGVRRLSLREARADFEQVAEIVTNRHPQLFTDREELASVITAQRALLHEGMSELELLRVLAPVSHATLCGHTRLMLSEKTEAAVNGAAPLLPLDVRVIDGRLYAIAKRAPSELPAGAEILSINGRTTAEILERLRACLPAEGRNQTMSDRLCAFSFPALLHTFVDASAAFRIDFATLADPEPHSINIAGVEQPKFSKPVVAQPAPVEPNHFRFEADHAVLTVQSLNFYDEAGRQKFRSFVTRFFADARSRKVRDLIIDLRNNGGGDPYCASELFRHLINRPAPYFAPDSPFYEDLKVPLEPAANRFDGRVFFLINGGCFSSTGHLCALLKFHRCGVFIGEETAGSYACTDASTTTVLKHSKLRFRHSQRAFAAAVSGLPFARGTMPDIPVVPGLEDCLQQRDPAMLRALECVRLMPGGRS